MLIHTAKIKVGKNLAGNKSTELILSVFIIHLIISSSSEGETTHGVVYPGDSILMEKYLGRLSRHGKRLKNQVTCHRDWQLSKQPGKYLPRKW